MYMPAQIQFQTVKMGENGPESDVQRLAEVVGVDHGEQPRGVGLRVPREERGSHVDDVA